MNYQNKLLQIINNLNKKPKLLLHSCCGPCSTQVIEFLTKYFDITVYYYNPNIEPAEEYEKRKQEQIKFIKKYKTVNKLDFLDSDYDNDSFKEIIFGLEKLPEGSIRCNKCFELRLRKTAKEALKKEYDYFGTTLTVSPHKNSKIVNEIGEKIANEINIKFIYGDFKKNGGYYRSVELAKKFDLYRQDYCGCISSKKEN